MHTASTVADMPTYATRTEDTEESVDRTAEQTAALAAALATAQIAERAAAEGAAQTTALQDTELTASERQASERHARIAFAAYLRAEQRGFEAGQDLDDWLAAEREVDAEASPPAEG